MDLGVQAVRRVFRWELSVLLLLAAMAAEAQVPGSNQSGQPAGTPPAPAAGTTPAEPGAAPATPKAEVTVTAPRVDQTLPKLPPEEFSNCLKQGGLGAKDFSWIMAASCEHQLDWERRSVIEACSNRAGNTASARIIQACTELLDGNVFEHYQLFLVFASRAGAYFALGDKQHALDDYNEAVKVAPHNADLYYDRGVLYAAQSDDDAALKDFDAAIGINSKLVPALRQRAKIYQARGNLGGALADYSEAIRVEPKTAVLWCERGYVSLRQHDYQSAIKDEAQAIELDPKQARAFFLRGVAFGGLGDKGSAVSDIRAAVGLDPSLGRYVVSQGKTAYLVLPPL
jgi:tetratricopeptide (TPR) repeat protein